MASTSSQEVASRSTCRCQASWNAKRPTAVVVTVYNHLNRFTDSQLCCFVGFTKDALELERQDLMLQCELHILSLSMTPVRCWSLLVCWLDWVRSPEGVNSSSSASVPTRPGTRLIMLGSQCSTTVSSAVV